MKGRESPKLGQNLVKEIQIVPVKPNNGLIGFCSFVLLDGIYCSSIAIFTRLQGGYRLVYPTKIVNGKEMHVFHPIDQELGKQIEEAVNRKLGELNF